PPLLGLEKLPHRGFAKCIETAAAFRKAWDMPSVRNVIMVARWGIYAEGTGNVSEANVRVRRFVEFDEDRNRAEFARLLRETVTTLAASGKVVTLFGPVPELPFNLPSEMIKDLMRGRTRDYAQLRSTFNARQAAVFPVLQEVSKIAGVRVLYPHEVLCNELLCQNVDSGQALYLDDDHLSRAGAEKLMSLIDSALSPIGSPGMAPAALR
nr:SGNH hydrolase domain-containing protein [Hyphomicrobium sp.]